MTTKERLVDVSLYDKDRDVDMNDVPQVKTDSVDES